VLGALGDARKASNEWHNFEWHNFNFIPFASTANRRECLSAIAGASVGPAAKRASGSVSISISPYRRRPVLGVYR